MPRPGQLSWRQLRVGAFVLIGLLSLAAGIYFINGQTSFFAPHYELKVYFPSAGDLRKGALVRLDGIPAGKVRRIAISSYSDRERSIEIDLQIEKRYQQEIRTDSAASMQTLGLLGETYVNITRGAPPHAVLTDGSAIRNHKDLGMREVMENANHALSNFRSLGANLNDITGQVERGQGSLGKMVQTHSFSNHVNKTVASAENLADQIEEGHGTLGKFFTNEETLDKKTAATQEHLNQIIAEVRDGNGTLGKLNRDRTLPKSFSQLATNIKTMTTNIKGGQGTLAQLTTSQQFHGRIRDTEKKLDVITTRMVQGKGSISQLSTSPQFLQSVNSSVKFLKGFLAEFRKHPRKYLAVRLHIF